MRFQFRVFWVAVLAVLGLLLTPMAGWAAPNPYQPMLSVQASSFTPQRGMWWNPARDGHGMDLQIAGDTMFMVWYTYENDGKPIWYLAYAPLNGTQWNASLERYSWTGSQAVPTVVGTVNMVFQARNQATFSWTLNGQSGSENFEPLIASTDIPDTNFTGHWFEPAFSGYGYTVVTQGDLEFAVLYFYDSAGAPRWALGVNSAGASDIGGAARSIQMETYSGFCPTCTWRQIAGTQVGTVTRSFDSNQNMSFSSSITLPSPMNGSWNISNANLAMLSEYVSSDRLEAESWVDQFINVAGNASSSVEQLSPLLSIVLSNSDACPMTSSQSGTVTLADPTVLNFSANYGAGCLTETGTTVGGSFVGILSMGSDGGSTLAIDIGLQVNNLTSDGQFLGNGIVYAGLMAQVTEAGLATGNGGFEFDELNTAEGRFDGIVGLQFSNVNVNGLFSMMSGDESSSGVDAVASLFAALGTNGSLQIGFDNLSSPTGTVDGTAGIRGLSSTAAGIDVDMQTNEGRIAADLTVSANGDGSYSIVSNGQGTMGPYSTSVDLLYDPAVCADNLAGGSITMAKPGFAGTVVFDGSCSGGYSFEEPL